MILRNGFVSHSGGITGSEGTYRQFLMLFGIRRNVPSIDPPGRRPYSISHLSGPVAPYLF